ATGSKGPNRIFATGGLRYWKDGRDVPDVMLATVDYPAQPAHPEFTLALRVNFKSGVPQEQFGFRFIGSEGVITTSMAAVTLAKAPPETAPSDQTPNADSLRPEREEKWVMPPRYDAHREHHRVFYEAIRAGKRPVEDAVFGFRAAGPALLSNVSY